MGSLSHLLGKSIRFTAYNSSLAFHYNFVAGYNIVFEKQKFVLQPAAMVRYTDPIPVQWTVMLKGTYAGKLWGGLVFRSDDAIGISAGLTIKERLNVGYGYDYQIGGLRGYQSGSHEIMLSFVLTKEKPSLDEEDDKLNKSIMDDLQKKNEQPKTPETPTTPTDKILLR
jgi:type IX secretion system PorP/SprF family membrane protein